MSYRGILGYATLSVLVGTSVVPEFGVIVFGVLVMSLMLILVITRTKSLSIVKL